MCGVWHHHQAQPAARRQQQWLQQQLCSSGLIYGLCTFLSVTGMHQQSKSTQGMVFFRGGLFGAHTAHRRWGWHHLPCV